MSIEYGFQATMTAKEGKADELVELLLSGPTVGPSAHEGCLVFLVSRSATEPDVVHLVEGWVSEEVHHTVFDDPESQGFIARCAELVAESQYADFVPLGGKAILAQAMTSSATGR
ncbi:antibiotic biosynthesis monooxygenase [Nocardioides sp. NPDC126508]